MSFKKGSLILVDYTAKVKDSNKAFETTIEEEAKKHSLHDSNIKYQPKLIAVGESWVLKGLDDALTNANVGDKTTVEVTPDKGFGERDSGKVRMIPLRKLGEDADKVSVGDSIEIDQKNGIVRYIGSGRVQVDYNHRFAGKTILYEINVIKALESNEDKIEGILKRHIPVENSKITFKKSNNTLDIPIPEELFLFDGLQVLKRLIENDIFKFIPTLEKVNFIEVHVNKQKDKPKEQAKTETKKEEKPIEKKTA